MAPVCRSSGLCRLSSAPLRCPLRCPLLSLTWLGAKHCGVAWDQGLCWHWPCGSGYHRPLFKSHHSISVTDQNVALRPLCFCNALYSVRCFALLIICLSCNALFVYWKSISFYSASWNHEEDFKKADK